MAARLLLNYTAMHSDSAHALYINAYEYDSNMTKATATAYTCKRGDGFIICGRVMSTFEHFQREQNVINGDYKMKTGSDWAYGNAKRL
jgi:hypothetical protein